MDPLSQDTLSGLFPIPSLIQYYHTTVSVASCYYRYAVIMTVLYYCSVCGSNSIVRCRRCSTLPAATAKEPVFLAIPVLPVPPNQNTTPTHSVRVY